MFLFTDTASVPANDPPVASETRSAPVTDALKGVATQSGVSFEYLMKTARRESNLVPAAKAGNSSASGLFQFLDQTWLGTIKRQGSKLGLQAESDQIVETPAGHYTVPNAQERARILALRYDPQISAKVAAALTTENKTILTDALGRTPSEGELYIAHFLGASGAGTLTRQASESPQIVAAMAFPDAAGANRSIFYDASGRARTVGEVYSLLVIGPGPATASFAPELSDVSVSASDAAKAEKASALVPTSGGTATIMGAKPASKPLFGLFRGNDNGAPEQPIQNSWSGAGRISYSLSEQPNAHDKSGFFPSDKVALADRIVPSQEPAAPSTPAADQRKMARLSVKPPKALPLNLLSFLKKRAATP